MVKHLKGQQELCLSVQVQMSFCYEKYTMDPLDTLMLPKTIFYQQYTNYQYHDAHFETNKVLVFKGRKWLSEKEVL